VRRQHVCGRPVLDDPLAWQDLHQAQRFLFPRDGAVFRDSMEPECQRHVNSIGFNDGKCSVAYLGGKFTRIRGVAVHNIAEVDTSVGRVQKASCIPPTARWRR
jgi:hypothetical protein